MSVLVCGMRSLHLVCWGRGGLLLYGWMDVFCGRGNNRLDLDPRAEGYAGAPHGGLFSMGQRGHVRPDRV